MEFEYEYPEVWTLMPTHAPYRFGGILRGLLEATMSAMTVYLLESEMLEFTTAATQLVDLRILCYRARRRIPMANAADPTATHRAPDPPMEREESESDPFFDTFLSD